MSELDRTSWAREAQRLEKQVAHRRKRIAELEVQADEMEARHTALLKKIAEDYDEENE